MSPLTAPNRQHNPLRRETLYDQGDHYFDALINAINSAQSSIALEVYIFDDDQVGRSVILALTDACRRGVDVRVIMDAAGSYDSAREISTKLEEAGVLVRIFHPLPWQIWHYQRSIQQGNPLDKALFFLRKINRRDHRKLCLIDEKVLFTGSLNISAQHLPFSQGGGGWRDYGVKIEGPVTKEILQQFEAVWLRQNTPQRQHRFKFYLSNISHWARRRKNLQLEKLLLSAKQKIFLTSAYFAPSRRVIRALQNAVERGINVKIIVPARSDIHLFPFLTATYYKDLLSSGIEIFEYQPSVLHAKLLIVDDQCILGSTNFNHRSFLHDLELDVFLLKQESRDFLETGFSQDLTHSVKIDPKASNSAAQNWLLKLFARCLRYWM